jgi:hypothetical protein
MSQIIPSQLIISLAMMLALGGCGNENSKVVFSPEGGHSADWTATHKEAANADIETCVECHGENLKGGISKVSCTQCHPAGPTSKHPVNWGDYTYARHSGFVAANSNVSCANVSCHGSALTGVQGSGPSCTTACHLGGKSAKHPAGWTQSQPYTVHAAYVKNQGYDFSSCSTSRCHGTDAKGVFLSGPSCFACHPADPTVDSPVPDKHPHNRVATWLNGHGSYSINVINGDIASCNTTICHGPGGPAPSCVGCHNQR